MTQLISLRDFEFVLYDILDVEQVCSSEKYGMHSRDVFDAILQSAKKLAEEKFEPHAQAIDQDPPELVDGKIKMMPAVKEAVDAFVENGFSAGPFAEEWGGLGLPVSICNAYYMLFYAANISTSSYVGLTAASAHMLAAHGSEALKAKYLPQLVAGEWLGTMCLSEPHAGSSLAKLRTTATPADDGVFHIKGSKMWITGGDHELTSNIIHFVLARLPGAPAGTKGISLFVVPKYLDEASDGQTRRNDVHLVGLNHKMGYRGSVNGVLEFGESEPCLGYMVGEPHQGLKYMFLMMNEARVGTGMGAAAIAYAGLRHAIDYARERPQGFKPGERDQSKPEVMIIEHADVRRMLLQQKTYIDASLHLIGYCSLLMDRLHIAQSEGSANAQALDLELALLTPIAKAWVTEYCIDANRLAIQVLAGCGYTHDYPVERLYRDNRLNTIVEGTTGIQALDLLGRKVTMGNGAALELLAGKIQATIGRAMSVPGLKGYAGELGIAAQKLANTTQSLISVAMQGETEAYLANATPYLHFVGHVVMAWLWLEQGMVVEAQLVDSPEDGFLRGKQKALAYFYGWELPKVEQWIKVLTPIDRTCLDMHPDWF
jgi:alkylation response protein AidB-like acyl-CoA dehydrogenase